MLKIQAQNADPDFNPFLVNMGCPTKEFLNFFKTFPRPKKVHDIKKVQAIVPVVPAQGLSAMVAFLVNFLFAEHLPAEFLGLLFWVALDFLGFLWILDNSWWFSHFHPLFIFFSIG